MTGTLHEIGQTAEDKDLGVTIDDKLIFPPTHSNTTGYKTGARYSQNARCERLRSSTQVSTLARNIEYQKAKRHRGCLHYDLFIAQL